MLGKAGLNDPSYPSSTFRLEIKTNLSSQPNNEPTVPSNSSMKKKIKKKTPTVVLKRLDPKVIQWYQQKLDKIVKMDDKKLRKKRNR